MLGAAAAGRLLLPPAPPGGEEEEAEGLAGEEPPCDKGEELENYETVLPDFERHGLEVEEGRAREVGSRSPRQHHPVTVERKVKDKEGKEIDGKVNTFRVTGVWLYDGTRPTDEERSHSTIISLNSVKGLLKPYFSADLQAEIKDRSRVGDGRESPGQAAGGGDRQGAGRGGVPGRFLRVGRHLQGEPAARERPL